MCQEKRLGPGVARVSKDKLEAPENKPDGCYSNLKSWAGAGTGALSWAEVEADPGKQPSSPRPAELREIQRRGEDESPAPQSAASMSASERWVRGPWMCSGI